MAERAEEPVEKKTTRRMVRRMLLFLLGCFMLIVVLDVDWTGRGGPPPTKIISYDGHQWRVTRTEFFRARGLDIKDVAPEENAALDYDIAAGLLPRFSRGAGMREANLQQAYVMRYRWSEDCAVLWSYFGAAEPALERARIGVAKTRAVAPYYLRDDLLAELPLPHLSASREMGRCFVCQGKAAEADARPRDALDAYLAAVAMGNHVAQAPLLIPGLVAFFMNEVGIGGFESWVLAGPQPDLLREALDRLRALKPGRPDFGHALRGEHARVLDVVRAYGKVGEEWDVMWRDAEGRIFGRSRTLRRIVIAKTRRLQAQVEAWNKLTGRARWRAYPSVEAAIAAARRDWFVRMQAGNLAAVVQVGSRYAVNDVRWAAAEVRIGLALYRAEHRRYPETLGEVEPYLGEVPLDPFVEEPFHYRLEGDEYVFYSVGPDLTDDGGVDLREDRTRLYGIGTNGRTWADQDDLVFTSKLAPPPALDEYIEHEGRRPPAGWSTEQ